MSAGRCSGLQQQLFTYKSTGSMRDVDLPASSRPIHSCIDLRWKPATRLPLRHVTTAASSARALYAHPFKTCHFQASVASAAFKSEALKWVTQLPSFITAHRRKPLQRLSRASQISPSQMDDSVPKLAAAPTLQSLLRLARLTDTCCFLPDLFSVCPVSAGTSAWLWSELSRVRFHFSTSNTQMNSVYLLDFRPRG